MRTKKTIHNFLIIALAILWLPMNQAYGQKGYKFGLRTGVNVSCAELSSAYTQLKVSKCETPPMAGYTYGLVFHFGYNHRLALQTGFELALKRFRLNFINHKAEIEQSSYVYSWDIPILVTHRSMLYKCKKLRYKSVYLKKSAGITISSVNMYEKRVDFSESAEYNYNYSITTPTKYDYIAIVGLALEFDSYKGHRVSNIGISYHHGFNDIIITQLDYTAGDLNETAGISGKNRYLSIDITYLLPR